MEQDNTTSNDDSGNISDDSNVSEELRIPPQNVNYQQSSTYGKKSDKRVVPSENANYMQSKDDEFSLRFKQNRKKELHVNKRVYHFFGPSSVTVPRSIVEHKDFESQRDDFTVRENKDAN